MKRSRHNAAGLLPAARPMNWPLGAFTSVLGLMAVIGLPYPQAWAQPAKPLPANAMPVQASNWLQQGNGASYSVTGSNAAVKLSGPATVLNWSSMDVGANASLSFSMPSGTSRVLNKVSGGAVNNRTTIDGMLTSNGQVYIYNPNGIVFGKTATVDVGALVASSLKMDDQRFMNGLLSPSAAANFALDSALGTGFVPGAVGVESGQVDGVLKQAAINAQQNGFILLLAPTVNNAGKLSAPDGQVLMAAGSKIYLAAPTDSTMRGMRVEVNSESLSALAGGASVTNAITGNIEVQRGNITLAGLTVNQLGKASATTSVNLNGSIYLKATDGATKFGATATPVASVGGTLVLGEGSSTGILPTLDDPATAAAAPAGQPFKPSVIELLGKNIALQKNAQVIATSGTVNITARANPNATASVPNSSGVVLGEGSVVDVSGSTGTVLSMESNVISAELRGGELADNILLRVSPVRGQTVYLDKRKLQANVDSGVAGAAQVANVKGYLNLAEKNVGEYTAAGGSINVVSEGSIAQVAGSVLNVSGGWVDHAAGYVNTSKLTLNGKLYDLESASASLPYDGVVRLADSRANFEAAYREGMDAGTVRLNAPSLSLSRQGELKGAVTNGNYQRDVGASSRPKGGQLLVGSVDDNTMDPITGRANFANVGLMSLASNIMVGSSPGHTDELVLDVNALSKAGFSRISAITAGNVRVAESVNLRSGGQLRLGAGDNLSWNDNITSQGGAVTASAQNQLTVKNGVAMDVSGTWQNDQNLVNPQRDGNGLPNGEVNTQGGAVRLYGNQVEIGKDVSMDVSGGAWLNASGTLRTGAGGTIALQATTFKTSLDASLQLGADVKLSGYGVSSNGQAAGASLNGGSLSLTGRNVVIGHGSVPSGVGAEDLYLTDNFFNQGGFATQTLTANGNLTVRGGAHIAPQAQASLLGRNYAFKTAGSMAAVSEVGKLDLAAASSADQRQASSLTLRSAGRPLLGDGLGVVTLAAGASIGTDPGANVTLSADRQVLVDGRINAPAGTVSLLLNKPNPDGSDSNYDNTQQIWLGQNAAILAQGSSARVFTNGSGVSSGSVLDGGTIRMGRLGGAGLESAVGYVVAEPGSLMDVSGTSQANLQFKSGAYVTEPMTVASAGGTIDVRAREGVVLAGQMRGTAGGNNARGGTLNVQLDREDKKGGTGYPQALRNLTITAASSNAALPAGLASGKPITGIEATGIVPLQSLEQGGFANLQFKSQDVITLSGAQAGGGGGVAIVAGSSLTLDAPHLRAAQDGNALGRAATTVDLVAPYIALGNADVRYQSPDAALNGKASLNVSGSTVDLVGNSATQGFGEVNITARHDIRLVGSPLQDAVGAAPGALQTGAKLNLTAAQVYPTTLSAFDLLLTSSPGTESTLQINASGQAPDMVYSAAGSVSVQADHIVQAGRVVAPFGTIALQANKDIIFESGSLTSVAGQGVVPFGSVVNGSDWTYDVAGQTINWRVNPSSDTTLGQLGLPGKRIAAVAPSVTQKAGAVWDLSGGGSLYAYEFTPGPGGSGDVLQGAAGAKNTTFAINPNYTSGVAPQDWQNGSDGLKVGDQIYLSAGNGLAAGFYTLLPGHYALLPGGYVVEPAKASNDMSARDNRVNADQSLLLAGYRVSSTDGRGDTRMSGFVVTPQAVVRQRSEFHDYNADKFFSAQAVMTGAVRPSLPADGGELSLDVQSQLQLNGMTRLAVASDTSLGGLRGTVDISAPLLNVSATRNSNSGDYVNVAADDLAAMGADSILLGGQRTRLGDGSVQLQVKSDIVRVDNDAAHPLRAAEIVLAARDTVQLTQRASVQAQAASLRGYSDMVIDPSGSTDGALLRASSGAQVGVNRAAAAGRTGRLEFNPGAQIQAGAALYLDATRSMALDGSLNLQDGTALAVHAPRIALGEGAPSGTDAANFDATALASLSKLGQLDLSSSGAIDAYGQVSLGSAAMQSLKLNAAQLQSHGSAMNVTAHTVELSGSSKADTAAVMQDANASQLSVNADNVRLGGGQLLVKGFGSTTISAKEQILAAGNAGRLAVDNQLTMKAERLSALPGAAGRFSAGGAMALNGVGSATHLPAAGLGGQLALDADSIQSSMNIAAPSGKIALLTSKGLQLNGGQLDVHGQAVSFGTGQAYAPAGSILLDGGSGNIVMGTNAGLDLSAQGATAGSLTVRAIGSPQAQVQLAGQLKAAATATAEGGALPEQGSFTMDVAQAPGETAFEALNAQLNQAGFTQSRDIRVRQGDVSLGTNGVVKARSIQLAADNGDLAIAGLLDASGPSGGSIGLYAGQATGAGNKGRVNLLATAVLDASATQAGGSAAGSAGDGGLVVMSSANADGGMASSTQGGASISAAMGSRMNVSGMGKGQGGTVLLRAPRVGTLAGSDVAVAQWGSDIVGSRATTVEGVKVYNAGSISEQADSPSNLNAGLYGRMANDARNFQTQESAVAKRLGRNDVQLNSGIEVRSTGDLAVSANEGALDANARGWNLNTWRFGGRTGTLTLRAGGDLLINGSISDGYRAGAGAMPTWVLDSDPASWNVRLIGGSDFHASNPLTVNTRGSGDVKLNFARSSTSAAPASSTDVPVALVRTGTGTIDVAAGRDVVLGKFVLPDPDSDTTLDQTFGATLYTAGRASALPADFAAPVNVSNTQYGSGAGSAAAFGVDGGSVNITAAGDVVGAPVPQMVNNWLFRQGRSKIDSSGTTVFETQRQSDGSVLTLNTAWWSRPDYFRTGVATFGGGNVNVKAVSGSVRDLSANAASSAYVPGSSPMGSSLVELGGGDLRVQAGQDILGGNFYVQKGSAMLQAGGSVKAGQLKSRDLSAEPPDSQDSVYTAVRPVIALGDASLRITAGQDLEVETIYNPTLARQSIFNAPGGNSLDDPQYSSFSTYGPQTQARLTALGGNLVLSNNAKLAAASANNALSTSTSAPDQPMSDPYATSYFQMLGYLPSKLEAVALSGSVTSGQGFAMAPDATGQLSVLAEKDITLITLPINGNLYPGIVMLDNDPASISSPFKPVALTASDLDVVVGKANGLSAHTAGQLHTSDTTPVRVIARTGSIMGQSNVLTSLNVPKRAEIAAGKDVRDLGFAIQHNQAGDVTTVQAGRDMIDSTNLSNSSPVKHVVTGPGLLAIQAGRDIDLGNSQGVVTRGNLDNAYLPAGGAGVSALAGVKTPIAPVMSNPFDAVQKQEDLFAALVKASSKNDQLLSFDALIEKAYPAETVQGGSINVFGSQFKTEQGGSLDLIAPGGSVVAGLVSVPQYLKNKSAAENGVFTVRGGAIRSLVKDDFTVNQGRVFTLGSGDVTLVSQDGNIDAGRGTKTASSAPPPLLTTDASGNTKIDIAGSIAGSGIATLRTSPNQAPSSVYAVAPRGVFDAGDAGVRSTGSVLINASVVLNAGNIQAAGGVAGTAISAAGLTSSAPPASTSGGAQEATKQMATAPKETLALSVEVLGYGNPGDEAGASRKDDAEERKKRPSAAGQEGSPASKP